MEVGRYYLDKNNYVAAINRFKTVVSEYQTTAHVEEALYRLTDAYLSLGIATEAQTAAAVLGHNFPQSQWYKDAYALLQKQGLMPQVSQRLVDDQGWKAGRSRRRSAAGRQAGAAPARLGAGDRQASAARSAAAVNARRPSSLTRSAA